MQTTLENNRTKFGNTISSEFWEIAVIVGDVLSIAAPCNYIAQNQINAW